MIDLILLKTFSQHETNQNTDYSLYYFSCHCGFQFGLERKYLDDESNIDFKCPKCSSFHDILKVQTVYAFIEYLNANLRSENQIFTFKDFQQAYLLRLGNSSKIELVTAVLKWFWDEIMINDDTSKTLNKLLTEGKPILNEYFGAGYRKHMWNSFQDSIGTADMEEYKDYEDENEDEDNI